MAGRYILNYKRFQDFRIDQASFQLEKLFGSSSSGDENSLVTTEISLSVGCTNYTITTFDCGYDHHSNGEWCTKLGIVMPYDVISSVYTANCQPGTAGGTVGTPGDGSGTGIPTGGGSVEGGTGNDQTPDIITLPTTAPLYIIQRPKGIICNTLNLDSEEIVQINSNDNVRLRIYQYLALLGINPQICNGVMTQEAETLIKALLTYVKDNPNINSNELNLEHLNSVHRFLENEDDILDPLKIFHRIKALDNALTQNPNLLLDIPCGELPKWQELANHPIPQSVKNKIFQVNGLTSWFKEAVIQNLDYSNSYTINMDVYPVKISSMPEKSPGVKYTYAEFFDYFRKNINDFTDINHGKFYPVVAPEYNIDDTQLWNSNTPLGSLITIKIPADNGTVVCSGWGSQAWIFTTVKSPWDGEHPVSGNRLFGYFIDVSGDMVIIQEV